MTKKQQGIKLTQFVMVKTQLAVILLQIVMVSPGTHRVKNHETNKSQLKKKRVQN